MGVVGLCRTTMEGQRRIPNGVHRCSSPSRGLPVMKSVAGDSSWFPLARGPRGFTPAPGVFLCAWCPVNFCSATPLLVLVGREDLRLCTKVVPLCEVSGRHEILSGDSSLGPVAARIFTLVQGVCPCVRCPDVMKSCSMIQLRQQILPIDFAPLRSFQ